VLSVSSHQAEAARNVGRRLFAIASSTTCSTPHRPALSSAPSISDSLRLHRRAPDLYAAKRLEAKAARSRRPGTRPLYLKCDIATSRQHRQRSGSGDLLAAPHSEPALMDLTERILPRSFAPTSNATPPHLLKRVRCIKRPHRTPADRGLPIGNLSSQFFANIISTSWTRRQARARAHQYVPT